MGDMTQLSQFSDARGLWMLVPVAVLLCICFKTGNLFEGLSFAIVTGLVCGTDRRSVHIFGYCEHRL